MQQKKQKNEEKMNGNSKEDEIKADSSLPPSQNTNEIEIDLENHSSSDNVFNDDEKLNEDSDTPPMNYPSVRRKEPLDSDSDSDVINGINIQMKNRLSFNTKGDLMQHLLVSPLRPQIIKDLPSRMRSMVNHSRDHGNGNILINKLHETIAKIPIILQRNNDQNTFEMNEILQNNYQCIKEYSNNVNIKHNKKYSSMFTHHQQISNNYENVEQQMKERLNDSLMKFKNSSSNLIQNNQHLQQIINDEKEVNCSLNDKIEAMEGMIEDRNTHISNFENILQEKLYLNEQKNGEIIQQLNEKHMIELHDLQLKLSNIEQEYNEYKVNIDEKMRFEMEKSKLIVQDLERTNAAFVQRIHDFEHCPPTVFRQMSPSSAMASPVYPSDGSFCKQISQSPLTYEQCRSLVSISVTEKMKLELKQKEQHIQNLEKQMENKNDAVLKVEQMLNESQIQRKMSIFKNEGFQKIIEIYELLTATKIECIIDHRLSDDDSDIVVSEDDGKSEVEVNVGKEYFICHTYNSHQESLLEYTLKRKSASSDYLIYNLLQSSEVRELPEYFLESSLFSESSSPLFMYRLLKTLFVG